MPRWLLGLALLAGAVGASAPAAASEWTVMLGAEGRVQPTFEGSDSYEVVPYPLIDIRPAGTAEHFKSSRDGFSFGLYESGPFRFGLVGHVVLPRNDSDDDALRGLGDVDWAVELGAFAEYWPVNWLRTRAELVQGIGGHHGLVADFSADVVVPVMPKLTVSGGPRLTLATASAISPYFDVTPAQSLASGLPVYDAGGGIRSYGVGAQARYQWTPRWESHVFVEYERLADDVADSPLVSLRGSPDQVQAGIGVSYTFDVPGLW
jgi:outer membrane protein